MREYYRIFKALLCFAVLLPPTIIFKKLRFPGYKAWPHIVHRSLCNALNIRVTTFGEPLEGPPTLFVSNHVSWIDILVLGHVIKACFIAKKDMIDWPVIGYLSSLQRTIFIDREKRADVIEQRKEMQDRMHNGDNLILFPEGTTSDGGRVMPFKSSLFGVTEDAMRLQPDEQGHMQELMVQPVTLVYKRINNMPTIRANRPSVAWYGDLEMGPHLKGVLNLLKIEVEVHFHEPVSRNLFKTRKELSTYCQRTIENRLLDSLRGKYP
ncbi:Acyl-CoA:1-acyl-sn-glycerol-3-phosphate acyltransferase [hydrothermal vent metagenome]|uniref:Acyl-CoA:1-acyl-sn-glycerol-3-phosphate acyltransferase n=1 Tax=hydrothermal vent metagenome TaxID=652676 RepID=A0A3B0RQH3_9ZZZZ